jgi:Na+/H+ antiporter NhaD/arsenite permease-like protein
MELDLLLIIPSLVFFAGYALITLEHKFHTNKSAIALALAAVLWVLAIFMIPDHALIEHTLEEAGAEVFSIVAFLLAAMGLIEILNHYRFFDLIRIKLLQLKLSEKKQFIMMGVLTFFLSAILDNLTVTIVMVQIARRFFKEQNLLVAAAGIVIFANAGGAWSPIGDITTIMIWLADKFTSWQIISQTILPSMVLAIVSGVLLTRQIKPSPYEDESETALRFSLGEKTIISACLLSFTFPIIMNGIGLQPYLGLLFGLGFVWLLIDFAKTRSKTPTHLNAHIDEILQKTDISSIKFFIGILLAVNALHVFGVLEALSLTLFGEHQEFMRVVWGNIFLGALSSVVDNVPLTAIAIDMIQLTDSTIWTLLAFTVGTGGSFLLIGSVAGVIASGMVKSLTFGKYLKIATIPAILGYIAGVTTWFVQLSFLH